MSDAQFNPQAWVPEDALVDRPAGTDADEWRLIDDIDPSYRT